VFIEAKDNGNVGDNWSYKSCKAPVKSSPPTNQHPIYFTGRMSFLSPNQQCQSTEGKNIIPWTCLPQAQPGGIPTLSLTTNSSWLPWGSVAMPLISPLMPIPLTVKICESTIPKGILGEVWGQVPTCLPKYQVPNLESSPKK